MSNITAKVSDTQSNHHYTQDSRVFELFLCSHLKYSSGLYTSDSDSLDTAQENKMHMIASAINAREGACVIDVGCGWGSLSLFLAKQYGCRVTGITPSQTQHQYILEKAKKQGVLEKITIKRSSIESVDLDQGSFDAATMLGSITHMPDKQAVVNKVHKLLARNGILYLSESCFKNKKIYDEFNHREGTEFIRNDIFGWGELLLLSDYVRFIENAGFSLTGMRDLSRDYYKTIEQWRINALHNADKIDALQAGKTDQLIRYFDIANAGWGYTSKHYAVTACKRR